MSHKITEETDTIDYIVERLTLILIKNQDLNFTNLVKLASLRTEIDNSETYLELIILSFIKFLDLDKSFKFTIKENVPSHKIFNAMNLNDDKINSHFVSFLTLVSPDIITILCTVTSQIASEFARSNLKNDSIDRIERIQSKVNSILDNKEENLINDYPSIETAVELKKTVKTKKKPLTIAHYIAGPSSQVKSRRKSYEISSDESKNTVSSYGSLNRKANKGKQSIRKIHLLPTVNDSVETASDTASRIYNSRKNESIIEEIPFGGIDSLPTREELEEAKIRRFKNKDVVEAVSSIVL